MTVDWGGGTINTLTNQKQKHENKASKAIDNVLRKIFGAEATLIIYKYLENNYSIRQDEIIEKIDLFVDALEELFSSGAYIVKQNILENLYSSHGKIHKPEVERTETKLTFVSQINFFSNN